MKMYEMDFTSVRECLWLLVQATSTAVPEQEPDISGTHMRTPCWRVLEALEGWRVCRHF